ncbi:hypothetical protein QZH41_005220 [Actinostola sp. cb2023]|nr:hypothetical protein QZH41_005220 [Actinostola sp. cb2023]
MFNIRRDSLKPIIVQPGINGTLLYGTPYWCCSVDNRSFEEHLHRLCLVFSRIRQAELKLKPAKCQFLKQRVTFLGHVVLSQGIETDPEKTKAVVDWPVPVDVKELQRFLGLVGYYRRFVTELSTTAEPLYRLCKKITPFQWGTKEQTAFVTEESLASTQQEDAAIGPVLTSLLQGEEKPTQQVLQSLSPTTRAVIAQFELLEVKNGIENFHRTLKSMIKTRVDEEPDRWDEHMEFCLMAYRSSVHSSTGHTPYELMFGREMRIPVDVMMGMVPEDESSECSYSESVSELRNKLAKGYEDVRTNQQAAQRRQKDAFDKGVRHTVYEPGDLVLRYSPQLTPGEASKFHRNWQAGPAEDLEDNNRDDAEWVHDDSGYDDAVIVHVSETNEKASPHANSVFSHTDGDFRKRSTDWSHYKNTGLLCGRAQTELFENADVTRSKDFDKLKEQGVNVTGKIVMIRYGRGGRGMKEDSVAMIFVSSHAMSWPSFVACSANADACVLANLTLAMCSFFLVSVTEEGNGYPRSFLRTHMREVKRRERDEEECNGYATLPYVHGVTERVKRVLEDHGIKTSVNPLCTLRQSLSKPKDTIPCNKKTGVVYQIPCEDCEAVYIGETGRSLGTRKKEHMASVRLAKTQASALAEHATKEGHDIAWDDTKIIATESSWVRRKWTEAWKITKNKNALFNRDSGRIVPGNYIPLVDK